MQKLVFFVVVLAAFLYTVGANPAWAASSTVINQQKRIVRLYNFLEDYNSPLKNYAQNFVEEADANNLDFRLLVAIAGVESTFGRQIPYNSYNAWGWGIYGDNMIRFTSYPEAINTISKSLRENYINEWGTKNVYQIGRIYAASPTWAQRVIYFMRRIEEENLPLSL